MLQMVYLLIGQFADTHGSEVGMTALVWLLIPLFAVVGAAIWGSWVSRDRTIGDMAELNGYARFRDAMEKAETRSEPV
ncbi:hypothetical protein ACIQ7D_12775 [Streptomyces sp. NPDC096310]|uniref:hypothetical protein n=1 Tax=Streptomyces sp. NPDC096310 TaxID=3366082 RepID=UPI003815A664